MARVRNLFLIGLMFVTQNVISGEIDVMTQNQYLGTDLAPVIAAAASGDLEAPPDERGGNK